MLGSALAQLHPENLRRLHVQLRGLIKARLWLQVLVAMALGVAVGLVLGGDLVAAPTAATLTAWLALPGYLFLALIQMIVIPLVVASIVLGMAAGENIETLRRTGLRVVGFFLLTTAAAVVIGVLVAGTLRPGELVDASLVDRAAGPQPTAAVEVEAPGAPSLAALPDRIVEIVPANPFKAGLEQNMTQVVLFAVLLGIALLSVSAKAARPLIDLLQAVQEVTMVVVRWAMYLVPLAVFGLLAQVTSRLGIDALWGVAAHVGTVVVGLLAVMAMYLVIYAVLVRRSPWAFLRASRDVLLLAFSTSSSAAVMPVSIRTAERALGVPSATAQFVIPLGTTINMAGTALYQVVATMFLAQVFQIDIGLSGVLLVAVLAIGASIGSPGTPGIGIVILAMLLGSVGVPEAGIALIIGVDRILDMCRTSVNVAGDLVAASVTAPRGQGRGDGPAAPDAPLT
ncbi:MAG: dicarboxylate/amino acid:cation symporter [Lysobacteraceae bacterium]